MVPPVCLPSTAVFVCKTGGVHGGRHVRASGATHPRDPGGLRDVGGKGHEEGQRHEHVHPQALEVDACRQCLVGGTTSR